MLYDWDPLGIYLSAKEPVTVRYWYGAWQRERAARRTERNQQQWS